MEGVWAIDENGKPTICKAKPENRGKGSCKHRAHQKPGQSRDSFFEENSVDINDVDKTECASIFEAEKIEIRQYKMSEEEKEQLPKICTRKDLKEPFNDGAYITMDDYLWNDMDKNSFAQIAPYSIKDINSILHGENYITLEDSEEHKMGEIISKEEHNRLESLGILTATGPEAMNDVAYRKYGFEATKDVYVLPYYMRQGIPDENGEEKDSDITQLYLKLFNTKAYNGVNAQKAYEQLVNNNNANTKATVHGGYSQKSLSDRFKGKSGIFRKDLTGYTIPYSGRAVIVPDVSIDYDEAKIPASMVADIFKPTIYNNLKRKGFTSEQIQELIDDAKRPQREVSPLTRGLFENALAEENVRVILDRQPTLHKASMQGFKPRISDTATVQVNPIIVKGYNADFDGDTMQVIAINSEKMTEYVDRAMHPSNFKFTPRNQSEMNMTPSKDAKWGIMNILNRRSN